MIMFTDTHCHIFEKEYDNYEDILIKLKDENIKRIIINGYDYHSNKEVIKLVKKFDNVYGSLGIHPNYINDMRGNEIEFISDNINHDKIIAVGEIGLDYYRNQDSKEKQLEIFNKLMKVAEVENKPVIIHNRNATEDLLKTIKNYKVKGIIHSFSNDIKIANEFIKLNYKLGINGIVTFKNSNLQNTLLSVDLNNILLETDSPYLSPEPLRSKINEPANIIYIAKKLSYIYNISLEDLSIKLEENFSDVFDI